MELLTEQDVFMKHYSPQPTPAKRLSQDRPTGTESHKNAKGLHHI